MADRLKGMVATSGGGDILGYLTWFSVPDQEVSLRSLRQKWQLAGLDPRPLPKDTKALNIFKRACRALEGRKKNGVITETTVALVVENSEECVYQISRLTRDLDEKIIDYPKAGRVIFNKYTEEVSFTPFAGVDRKEVLDMFDAIEEFMRESASKVTGAKVRTLVRNYLKNEDDETSNTVGLGGENLRGKAGGIYFVPQRHKDALDSLSEMLSDLYKDNTAYLHTVAMANSEGEREIIRRHHIANAKNELREAIAEAKQIISDTDTRGRSPRSDLVANQWGRFNRLVRHSSTYREILEDESDEIHQMQSILKKQLDRLL